MRSGEGRRSGGGRSFRAAGLAGAIAVAGFASGGCSLLSDAATSATAPLSALPATDVVVETNLETQLGSGLGLGSGAGLGGVTGVPGGQLGGGLPFAGAPVVSGPSTGPTEISSTTIGAGSFLIVEYNNLTQDCLGILRLSGSIGAVVLGRSSPGTYYFVERSTPTGGCASSTFAGEPTVPKGWPGDDPSSAGFPPS
jgi:hypothetical protein